MRSTDEFPLDSTEVVLYDAVVAASSAIHVIDVLAVTAAIELADVITIARSEGPDCGSSHYPNHSGLCTVAVSLRIHTHVGVETDL